MLDLFLFVGLPYVAIIICIVGVLHRFRSDEYHISSLSSQFLESRKLLWGSAPWHLGIGVLFIGHLMAFLIPGLWHSILTAPFALIMVEVLGIASALLCLVGLAVLLYRRVTSANLQSVTTTGDIVVLGLLLLQVCFGLATAMMYRWGSTWSTGTLTPYIWGLITLRPDMTLVNDLPLIIQAHLIGAWLILIAIPFSRLIHMFSIPLQYLSRAPQRVVWNNPRRSLQAVQAEIRSDSRRLFLKGATGLAAAGALLSLGVMDKLYRFFQTPDLSYEDEGTLMETRLKRLRLTAQEQELELERLRSDSIFVAYLDELDASRGKYFIDYDMRPSLAFLNDDGLPLLISAKCTHLGCTVGNQVDDLGRILCPCHISYFDVRTGIPNPGAPARDPLPKLGWVLRTESSEDTAWSGTDGKISGKLDGTYTGRYSVYILKRHHEEV